MRTTTADVLRALACAGQGIMAVPHYVIGDLLASPVETLWNGPRLRELRRQMHSAPSPACLACPRF